MPPGIYALLGTTSAMAAALGTILYHQELARLASRAFHRVHPPPERPSGPPIERIAADARRLRALVATAGPDIPMARLTGWRAAYDDVLIEGMHALGIEDRLSDLPPGTERDAERLRVEYLLEQAGLGLNWPGGRRGP